MKRFMIIICVFVVVCVALALLQNRVTVQAQTFSEEIDFLQSTWVQQGTAALPHIEQFVTRWQEECWLWEFLLPHNEVEAINGLFYRSQRMWLDGAEETGAELELLRGKLCDVYQKHSFGFRNLF